MVYTIKLARPQNLHFLSVKFVPVFTHIGTGVGPKYSCVQLSCMGFCGFRLITQYKTKQSPPLKPFVVPLLFSPFSLSSYPSVFSCLAD